jgi:DNA polymerase-3 subunit gamma/tau
MPLHTEHRPDNFDEFYGNDATVKSLKSYLKEDSKKQNSFLFHGPSGCGKTTLARIMAKELGCDIKSNSLIEINAATETGIDTVRNIIKTLWLKPMFGDIKVYIIDEVHSVSKAFQNGILKPLEDTPPFAYFMLCTTEPQKLLKTIRNRCANFAVNHLSIQEIEKLLESILEKEKKDITDDAFFTIADRATGCPRQALVMLGQVIDLPPEDQAAAAQSYRTIEEKAFELARALFRGDNWPNIQPLLQSIEKGSEEGVRHLVLTYINSVALKERDVRSINHAANIYKAFKNPFYDVKMPGLTFACWAVVEGLDFNI